jgi:hypothetical protein
MKSRAPDYDLSEHNAAGSCGVQPAFGVRRISMALYLFGFLKSGAE